MSFEESERRALLEKKWSRYKTAEFTTEMNTVQRAINSQNKALAELRLESEELYQAAIQVHCIVNYGERRYFRAVHIFA